MTQEPTLQDKLNAAADARRAWRDDAILFGIGAILLLFVGGIAVFENDGVLAQYGYITNAFTELLGIGVTVLVLNRLAERREAARQREQDIKRIIREMRSPNADEGARAVDEAREMGILTDGTLQKANLFRANLSGAILGEANLSGASLFDANLSGASLRSANLSGAILGEANLSGAYLEGANLSGASLWSANLSGTKLWDANLSGASLRNANVSGADLGGVTYDEKTVLPDAKTRGKDDEGNEIFDKTWTLDTDMSRYTNPNHPDFWQPNYAAAGFETDRKWVKAGDGIFEGPRPWVAAGYGRKEWNEWVRDGKPTLEQAVKAGREIPIWVAAGFETSREWADAGKPLPWVDAGYGWNDWLRDGKPTPEQAAELGRYSYWVAAGFETFSEWWDADEPRPWVFAGYGEDEWNEWLRDGKPATRPAPGTDDTPTDDA